jgi:mycofactocin precursor
MSNPTASAPILDGRVEAETRSPSSSDTAATPAIESEMLIEEISIDGMCGVY